jgi:hypothetical protein
MQCNALKRSETYPAIRRRLMKSEYNGLRGVMQSRRIAKITQLKSGEWIIVVLMNDSLIHLFEQEIMTLEKMIQKREGQKQFWKIRNNNDKLLALPHRMHWWTFTIADL